MTQDIAAASGTDAEHAGSVLARLLLASPEVSAVTALGCAEADGGWLEYDLEVTLADGRVIRCAEIRTAG